MAAVADAGWMPVAAPLLSLRRLPWSLPAPVASTIQAILLTSGQAVAALSAIPHDRLVLTVGDTTASRARSAGFTHVVSAAADADALARLVLESLQPADGSLLLACGRGQGMALARSLRRHGFEVIRRCVYAADAADALPDAALAALQGDGLDAALFFSGETASAFIRLLPTPLHATLAPIRAVAISPAVAAVLRPLPWRGIEAAAMPNAASMLGLLGRFSF